MPRDSLYRLTIELALIAICRKSSGGYSVVKTLAIAHPLSDESVDLSSRQHVSAAFLSNLSILTTPHQRASA